MRAHSLYAAEIWSPTETVQIDRPLFLCHCCRIIVWATLTCTVHKLAIKHVDQGTLNMVGRNT
jgi:hypothetical protein